MRKKSYFEILQETLPGTHLMELLDKMYKYKIDPTRTLGATERTPDACRTNGQTDGRSETNIPPTISMCGGIITSEWIDKIQRWNN